MADEEKQNLEHAKRLWTALKGIPVPMEERVAHLYRILKLAELLRVSPVKYADPRRGVHDVLCSGTTDMAAVIGANSRLRSDCAKCLAGGSRHEFSRNPTLLQHKLGFKVGAFDGETSRLCQAMANERGGVAATAPIPRPFQACAEHVVFEKLDRLGGQQPRFTYAVQKTGGSKKQSSFEVKIVKRCDNCQVAGGSATVPDREPFGMTPRLGRVVTDNASLIGLDVPVVTARVLQYFRFVLGTYYGYDTVDATSDDAPPMLVRDDIPEVRVWSAVGMRQHAIVPSLGSTDPIIINQELRDAGLQNGLLDIPHPDPHHDELKK